MDETSSSRQKWAPSGARLLRLCRDIARVNPRFKEFAALQDVQESPVQNRTVRISRALFYPAFDPIERRLCEAPPAHCAGGGAAPRFRRLARSTAVKATMCACALEIAVQDSWLLFSH
jgi:hypothetical protein